MSGEDPLTDEKTAMVGEAEPDTFSPVSVGLKCWRAGEIQVRIILPVSYAEVRRFQPFTAVQIRVDKNEPLTLVMVPVSMDGRIALVSTVKSPADLQGDRISDVLQQLQSATLRVVLGVNGGTVILPANGAAKSVTKFAQRCELALGDDAGPPEDPKILGSAASEAIKKRLAPGGGKRR